MFYIMRGPDRKWRNSDGSTFDGYDDGDGRTTWYESGTDHLDSVTDTPDDFEQSMNDEGYY